MDGPFSDLPRVGHHRHSLNYLEVVAIKFVVIAGFLCLSVVSAQTGANPQWDALMEAGHWKRLRQLADDKLKANPNDPQARLWLSKIKSSFGDHYGALAEAERAVALDQNNPGAHAQLAEASAFLADRSSALSALSHVRRMKKSLDASLALNPNNLDALLVQMMFSWKAPGIAGGDKKKAVRIADQIVAHLPSGATSLTPACCRNRVTTPPSNAGSKELSKPIQVLPRPHLSCPLLLLHRQNQTSRQSRTSLARCHPARSRRHRSYETLAYVLAAKQRWPELEATLARAEKAVPDDTAPFYFAATALLDIGRDFRRAEQYLNHYLSATPEGRQPTHAQTRLLLASLYTKEGRKADAIRELTIASGWSLPSKPPKQNLSGSNRTSPADRLEAQFHVLLRCHP